MVKLVYQAAILIALLCGVTGELFSQSRSGVSNQNGAAVDDSQRRKGLELVGQQSWAEALDIFSGLVAKKASDHEARYWMAVALFNLRRSDEARQHLQIIENSLAHILVGAKKQGAVVAKQRSLMADVLVLGAVIAAVNRNNPLAIKKLKSAVSLAPEHFDANLSLGRALFGENLFDEAIKYFSSSKKLRPNDPRARFFLATTYERVGNVVSALQEYEGLIAIAPNSFEGSLGKGVLILKNFPDRIAEGIAALTAALKIRGDLYEARVELGKALIKTGAAEEALIHLQVAAELNPGNPEPRYQLSIAYRKLGRKAEADEQSEMVRRIHESRRGPGKP